MTNCRIWAAGCQSYNSELSHGKTGSEARNPHSRSNVETSKNRNKATTAKLRDFLENWILIKVHPVNTQLLEKSNKLSKADSANCEPLSQNGGTRTPSQGATVKKRAAKKGWDKKGMTQQEDGSPLTMQCGSEPQPSLARLMAPLRVVLFTSQSIP